MCGEPLLLQVHVHVLMFTDTHSHTYSLFPWVICLQWRTGWPMSFPSAQCWPRRLSALKTVTLWHCRCVTYCIVVIVHVHCIMHIHVYVVYMDCVRYIVACICCTQRYYTMYSTHDTSPLPCNVNYYQCNLELSIFIYTCMSIIFVEMLLWELVSLCMYIYMHSVTMHKMQ